MATKLPFLFDPGSVPENVRVTWVGSLELIVDPDSLFNSGRCVGFEPNEGVFFLIDPAVENCMASPN
jgi:hypothetical protein